ncbi:aminotransferase class I/II-fold pyridoxal phosphate-dependent enzyme [Goodfellowiella coeruleoviolacea]|uniref:Enduracididine biosynthesis enzyme MppQ n=1 Tax=Goodfellowiella coeruleoviolacea TaxID=334858 RepID=A0AAE3KEX4_9PSEU|nr:aminotransferase class I/II-fold pyridoxal phosphate-dependent enzyme [Goodfellowiella coeruleoviolacea]MCP2164347.1 enduracididine biosynthesis enzyme MppQ [Goodfellowiella coeruleoviolacea]
MAGPLSHRRAWRTGVVQQVCPDGVLDLGPGYLDPDLLPADLLAAAYHGALTEFGSAALAYGDDRGAVPFRAAVADRVARADDRPCGPEHVLVTAGTSHALYLLATAMATPGDVVLVEQYGYDLGRQLLADCGLRPRPVAMDGAGMDPAAFEEAVTSVRAHGGRVAFACLIPTYHNPTGLVVPEARRRDLLAVAQRLGVLVVEDDAYAELDLDATPAPCSMAGLADYHGVIRLRTLSKTLAPGLRLGCLLAAPDVVTRLANHAVFVSGGSANHVTSLAVAHLLRSGAYDRHLTWLRNRLRTSRDALAGALLPALGPDFACQVPAGGYFLWVRCTTRSEPDLLAAAEAAGVRVAAGSRFGAGPHAAVRLAYSFTAPDQLVTAAGLLASAWQPVPVTHL